jgi:hypothetical protein
MLTCENTRQQSGGQPTDGPCEGVGDESGTGRATLAIHA